jgi:hypothetical protein
MRYSIRASDLAMGIATTVVRVRPDGANVIAGSIVAAAAKPPAAILCDDSHEMAGFIG